ncbi:MAG: glycosyltransferase family 2 protein, partial [Nanoarchaeota archaeon]
IIVVDDGSSDKTASKARKAGAEVIEHKKNKGVGRATRTGFSHAISKNADIIVTFDSDGQHCADDIKKVIRPIINKKADVVIGTRLKSPKGMPLIRVIGNFALNVITYLLFFVWTTDSQSGFKAFSRNAASKTEIKSTGMEFCSEIIKEIGAKNLRYTEVPIKTIYTEYSMSRGQSSLNGFRIFGRLLFIRFGRY